MQFSSGLFNKRRVAAELSAYVIWKQFPGTTLLGGGVTKIGFYYDFIFEQKLQDDFLSFFEMHLKTLIKEELPIRFASMMRENAQSFFIHCHQPALAEIAGRQDLNIIDLIHLNGFSGICPALPLTSTADAGHVKLFDMQQNECVFNQESYTVTRIVGTAFDSFSDLKQFSKQYERYLKKKDHRLLGKELNLFSRYEAIGEMEYLWHPKGLLLRQLLQNWVESQGKLNDYQVIETPLLIKRRKKERQEGALCVEPIGDSQYELSVTRLKQHLIYLNSLIQAKEVLPIKLVEYATTYQAQSKNELFGLLCSDSVYADQRTIACPKEFLNRYLISSLLFIEQIIRIFGFEAHWYLIVSKEKGKAKIERDAIGWLKNAVQQESLRYSFQEGNQEEDHLFGPRLELRIVDSLQREWPTSTVSIIVHEGKTLDFFKHQGQNKEDPNRCIVISQSLWGSLDRFIALLIEFYEGQLPIWLAPEQVRLLTVSGEKNSFAHEIFEKSRQQGIRIKSDLRDIKLSQKIHDVRRENVPYIVIIGEKETKKKLLTVQSIKRPDKSEVLELDEFIAMILQEAKVPVLT